LDIESVGRSGTRTSSFFDKLPVAVGVCEALVMVRKAMMRVHDSRMFWPLGGCVVGRMAAPKTYCINKPGVLTLAFGRQWTNIR
jgi:hypothetical protein